MSLIDQVTEGILDIAVVYAPQQRSGLKIGFLIEEKRVLVTTSRRGQAQRATDYVFVDWGSDFAARHNLAFPELSNAGTFVGLGPLGLQYILDAGGSGFFRMNVVRPHLKSGRLRLAAGATEFAYPAYAVYSEDADAQVVTPALVVLRHVTGPDFRRGPRLNARRSDAVSSRAAPRAGLLPR